MNVSLFMIYGLYITIILLYFIRNISYCKKENFTGKIFFFL